MTKYKEKLHKVNMAGYKEGLENGLKIGIIILARSLVHGSGKEKTKRILKDILRDTNWNRL